MAVDSAEREFLQFDVKTLVQQGRQALRERRYAPAARMLREAARRAPFRQDVREWLGMAMEGVAVHGQSAQQEAHPTPRAPRSSAPAPEIPDFPPARRAQPRSQDDLKAFAAVNFREQGPEPERRSVASARRPVNHSPANYADDEDLEPPSPMQVSREQAAAASLLMGRGQRRPPPPSPASAPRPAYGFERKRPIAAAPARNGDSARPRARDMAPPRRRSPIVPMALGMLIMFVTMAAVGAGGWYLVKYQKSAREREQAERIQSAVNRANEFKQRGDYALALEQLNSLPASAQRDEELTRLYRDKAASNINAQPPDYSNAIQDYGNALKLQPRNTDIGLQLGIAYYQLARDQHDRDINASKQNLEMAQQTFEHVLELDPNSVPALNKLAQIATLQRDPVLQKQYYESIIKIDPQSADAQEARRNLKSLGFMTTM